MTRIYGASDDLIEIDGDVRGETDGGDEPTTLMCSDGTVLVVRYGKPDLGGVWAVEVKEKGSLFDRLEICTDEEGNPYSDQAFFKEGIKWVRRGDTGEKVK